MEDVIDQLQIELTSSADNVNKGINDMIASLKKLENIGNRGNIKKVTQQLKGFQKLDFTNFCKQLGTIERRLTAISKLKDTLSSLSKTTIGDVTSDIKHTAANNANATIGATEEQAIDIDTGDARREIESITDEVRQFGEEFVIANNKVTSGNGDIENTVERLTRMIELQKEKVMELQAVWEVAMENGADESVINNAEMRMLRAQGTVETLEKQLATAQSKENVGTFSEQESAAVTQVQTDCNNLLQSFSAINQQIQDAKTQITAMLGEKQAEFSTDKNFVAGTSFVEGLDDKVQKLNNSLTILNAEFSEMQARANPPSEEEWLQFENRVLSTRTQLKNLAAQAEKTANAVASIGDAGEESGKKTGGFASKFMASLKRIALYRIVRAVLKEITQAFQEGMQNYVQYSEEANETISELKSVWQQLSNTLGVTVTQLLILISPLLQTLCDMLIDVVNGVNYFLAVISGKESYSKAIKQTTDYADSLNEVQNSLLGIDEINKLSDNDSVDYSSMFEEVDVISISSSWSDTLAIVTALITALTAFAGSGVLSTITSLWTKFTTKLKSLSTVAKAATTVAALAIEFYTCYENLYQVFKGTQDWEDALSTLIPVIAAVSVVLVALYGKIGIILAVVTAVSAAVAAWTMAQDELRAEICSAAFWDSLNRYGTSLDDLCSYMERTYSWTTTLAEATTEWQTEEEALIEEISSSLSIFTQYNNKLKETGQLTEDEAAAMTEALSQMVEDMKTIVEGSEEQVWDVFEALFQDASEDFINQLGDMKEAFEEFMGIFNDSVTDAEQQIEDLIEKSAGEGLTDEEKQTLQTLTDYVTDLANITVTINSANFENTVSSLEELLAEGINISDTEELESFLSDLSTYATGYKEDLKASYEEAVESINYYQKLVDTMYKYNQIDSETYDYYSQVFDDALDTLEEGYKDNVAAIDSDVQSILDQIQTEIAISITVSAAEGLNNKGWWETYQRGTITGAEEGYSQASEMIEAINSVIEALGYDSSVSWLAQWYEETVGEYDGALSVLENVWDFLGLSGGLNSNDNYGDAVEILQSMTEWLESNGYINGYATGGLPESGELFMARENGIPEMVGSWGSNHTAVANNEQIVEGIKQGVYEAMVEAGSSDSGNITVQFVSDGQIKSEQIISAAERRNRRDGKKVISVEV